MRRKKTYNHTNSINNFIFRNIKENINIYFKVMALLVIGIVIGVILSSRRNEIEIQETNEYINETISNLKDENIISKSDLAKHSILKNITILIIIWILGLTFSGKCLLYITILIFGLAFGITYSTILSPLNFAKGMLFTSISILPQSIIMIPSIIFICSNGIILHKRNSKNAKINSIAIKFTAVCLLGLLLLLASSFVESYVSVFLLNKFLKYL